MHMFSQIFNYPSTILLALLSTGGKGLAAFNLRARRVRCVGGPDQQICI